MVQQSPAYSLISCCLSLDQWPDWEREACWVRINGRPAKWNWAVVNWPPTQGVAWAGSRHAAPHG